MDNSEIIKDNRIGNYSQNYIKLCNNSIPKFKNTGIEIVEVTAA